jgi:hypothetical protein
VGSAAPLIDLQVEGDPDGVFELDALRPRAIDPVLSAMDFYPPEMQGRLTVYRPKEPGDAIWLHPGEPVFDRFCETLLSRHGDDAQRGAIFIDPHATAPYLFHLAQVSVVRKQVGLERNDLLTSSSHQPVPEEIVESRLIGLRQESNGTTTLCPIEHLLLLSGARNIAPGSVPLARLARGLTQAAGDWIHKGALNGIVEEHRAKIELSLPERLDWLSRGYDHKTAELIAKRQHVAEEARRGDPRARAELTKVKDQQRELTAERDRHLALLKAEPTLIVPGEVTLVAHALVLPTDDPEEKKRYDEDVEAIAMRLARIHEETAGATVHDVHTPELARRAGLQDWPGFDLRSRRPATIHFAAEERAIEVKGCAQSGAVEVSANEWARACILRENYWLYVVFDCATPKPRLVRVRDPFGRLLARAKGSVLINAGQIISAAEEA